MSRSGRGQAENAAVSIQTRRMNGLVKYEAARLALLEAKRVDEVKDIRDKAEALAAYAKQAKDTDMIAWATEIKVRAERRCGEMLIEKRLNGEMAVGGRPTAGTQENLSNVTTSLVTLPNIGLSRDESSRYQKLARMPEPESLQTNPSGVCLSRRQLDDTGLVSRKLTALAA